MTSNSKSTAVGLKKAAATLRESGNMFLAAAEALRECAKYAEEFASHIEAGGVVPKLQSADEPETAANGKRKRKKKDPNAPKRPASTYLVFQNDVRNGLKQKFPDLAHVDIMAMVAEQWANMTEADKAVYQEKVNKDKERYAAEKSAYDARSPEEVARANAEAAAAAAAKKPRQRKPKVVKATPVSAPIITTEDDESDEEPARAAEPAPPVAQSESDSSEDDEEDEDEEDDDDEEEDEEEEEQPPAKKAKVVTPPPVVVKKKEKKEVEKKEKDKKKKSGKA
ncbi:HMG box domain-containing protein [Mycena kentingensis (nom. inval.)]|nr:HMG box domain-containing protein [Mycena kentingensis (nom. inval.)]